MPRQESQSLDASVFCVHHDLPRSEQRVCLQSTSHTEETAVHSQCLLCTAVCLQTHCDRLFIQARQPARYDTKEKKKEPV